MGFIGITARKMDNLPFDQRAFLSMVDLGGIGAVSLGRNDRGALKPASHHHHCAIYGFRTKSRLRARYPYISG
jgi:hypothetical protein